MARFLQLTDMHVTKPGTLSSSVLDTSAILRNAIDRLLTRQEAISPIDALLVTGDISDDGTAESYAIARAEFERLGLRLLVVPGNHDAREAFRKAFADLPEIPRTGPIDWATQVGDTHVIGLDTLIEGQGGGRLSNQSLSFLSDALNAAGREDVVIAMHHPPLQTNIKFMDAIGLQNTDALAEVLNHAAGRVRVVAGHVHGIFHGQIGQHPVATAPAVCSAFALDQRADAPVGFMSGPTGCAVFDTAKDGTWVAIPLDPAEGPFPF